MEVRKTKVSSSKGNLATVIHYPEVKTKKLAILCSGFLNSKDYKNLISLANNLSEEGYTAVRFDATGLWESDGEIIDYTMTQYLKDIKNILEYMLEESDYNYILLGGHSRGASLAVSYASQDSRISIVLAIMPPSAISVHKWNEKGIRISYRNLPDNLDKKKKFEVPLSCLEGKKNFNIKKDVKKIAIPIIFIAGEKDHLVSPQSVEKIFNNANQPKEFLTIPDIGHDYRLEDKYLKLVNKNILELINKYD